MIIRYNEVGPDEAQEPEMDASQKWWVSRAAILAVVTGLPGLKILASGWVVGLIPLGVAALCLHIIYDIVSKERRAEQEAEALRIQAEQEREALRIQAEQEERERVIALPGAADAKWLDARNDARIAARYLDKAVAALKDNRAAAFYENLSGSLNYIRYTSSETDQGRERVREYEAERHTYQLPSHAAGDEDMSLLSDAIARLKEHAADLFLAAERMTSFVTIRLQMEGNKEAAEFHKKSLAQGEKIISAQYWTALQTAELADAVDQLAETVGGGFSELEDVVREAAESTVDVINAAAKGAQGSLDELVKTTETSQDALHDIHRKMVKPSFTNRYRG